MSEHCKSCDGTGLSGAGVFDPPCPACGGSGYPRMVTLPVEAIAMLVLAASHGLRHLYWNDLDSELIEQAIAAAEAELKEEEQC